MGTSQAETSSVPAIAPELGMRRVRWVEILVGDDGVRAEVAGLAHRFPITRPVTVQVANQLIRAGYPYLVRRSGRAASQAVASPAVAPQPVEPGGS